MESSRDVRPSSDEERLRVLLHVLDREDLCQPRVRRRFRQQGDAILNDLYDELCDDEVHLGRYPVCQAFRPERVVRSTHPDPPARKDQTLNALILILIIVQLLILGVLIYRSHS